MKLRFTYCAVRVRDLKLSLKFYGGVMGLKQIGRGKMKHGGIYVLLEDEKTKQKLELNWYPKKSKFYTEYVVGEGIDHLGFIVEDVRKMHAKMISKGAVPAAAPWQEVSGDQRSWIGFVKDPNGIWIELISH